MARLWLLPVLLLLSGCGDYTEKPACERWEMQVATEILDGSWHVYTTEYCVVQMQKLPPELEKAKP